MWYNSICKATGGAKPVRQVAQKILKFLYKMEEPKNDKFDTFYHNG
jgi:hypothetical protein